MVSVPCFSTMRTIFSAISLIACSQLMRCQRPEPRSPTRFMGTVRRLGPYITSV